MTIREAAERLPTDKLRRAAQRILGDTSDAAWPVDEDTTRDTESVAHAILADNPADSEMPITSSWLIDVGGRGYNPYAAGAWFPLSPVDCARGMNLDVTEKGGWFRWFIGGKEFIGPKTRRQFRALAEGLGITLEEAK